MSVNFVFNGLDKQLVMRVGIVKLLIKENNSSLLEQHTFHMPHMPIQNAKHVQSVLLPHPNKKGACF